MISSNHDGGFTNHLGASEHDLQEQMDEIRNQEKIMSILNRYKDYPVSDIFKIKHFFNLLVANIFIYIRYQIMLYTFSKLKE